MKNNTVQRKRGLGALMFALSLLMVGTTSTVFATPVYAATVSTTAGVQSTLPKTLPASGKVLEVIKYDTPVLTTKAKPAPHIKMVIDGKQQQLTDPMLLENGRVFLPIRNVGKLLGINVDYLEKEKIAVAYNEKAYLELPLGYNTAVKDQTILLPVDANNKDTRIITYNNRTYLPVRFVSENLGFNITYANNTVTVNTKGDTPDVPNTNGQLDVSNMNPSDPNNAHNLNAFKDGRSLSVLPKAPWSQVKKPEGVSDKYWNNCSKSYNNGVVMATGKLSDMPKDLNIVKNGVEDFDAKTSTVPKITVNSKGALVSSRGGAPTVIFFNDGTTVQVNMGADASMGRDENGNYKPGKGVDDIACIVVADVESRAAYVFQVTGE